MNIFWEIRIWLIRIISGKVPVMLNCYYENGSFIFNRPSIIRDNYIDLGDNSLMCDEYTDDSKKSAFLVLR